MLGHPVEHYVRLLRNTPYRKRYLEMRRLGNLARYTPTQTSLTQPPIEMPDGPTFAYMYRSIFEREVYKFKAKTDTPYILDGGANIGLSVLYFKKIYPDARIVAFEPDPKIYAFLQKNVQNAALRDVELVNRALWTEETSLWFASEGADAGRIANDTEDAKDCEVKTVRLRDYLDRPIDFLKLDIEGAETAVIEDCHDKLADVQRIFLEYHSFENRVQTFDTALTILKDSGFRVHIHAENVSDQPFIERKLLLGMDLQVDIFAYRV